MSNVIIALTFFLGNVTAYFPEQRPSTLVARISTMLLVITQRTCRRLSPASLPA